MRTAPPQRHQVTVTLPRPAGNDQLVPPDAQVLAEAAAAAVGAGDLMTVWTASRVALTMTVETPCEADALSAGWAVARTMGGGLGASVTAEPVPPCAEVGPPGERRY